MRSWPAPVVPALPIPDSSAPPLRLFDTSTGAVQIAGPDGPGPASIYVCGITPYDATHLGHAATYLAFDLVQRYWLAAGRPVRYVQNVTDVDDPLLERAVRDGVHWSDLAEQQIELFRTDMAALRILPPEQYVGAVEAMGEIASAVADLLASGAAYRVLDAEFPDIYFDIAATGQFGYESRYSPAQMLDFFGERGGDPDRPGKRHPLDPLLWRMERVGEPAWESALGRGRAGWHVECAVIAANRLGMGFCVQGGGSDLIFPHHECSAAHAESLTGATRFAKHYVHTGMVGLGGEKMSKSRGNLVFVSRLRADGVDPMAIRVALLGAHYRSDWMWSVDVLRTAEKRLAAWRAAAARIGRAGEPPATAGRAGVGNPDVDRSGLVTELVAALADDLDTPRALGVLDRWAAGQDDPRVGMRVVTAVDALLGIELTAATPAERC